MMAERKLTGRTVLIIAVTAFGVVIAANMAMLYAATGTFPGLVVKNSYVASQGWDARKAEQAALGWQSAIAFRGDTLTASLTDETGARVEGLAVTATIGRPASDVADQTIKLAAGAGAYAAPLTLAPGQWRVEITASDAKGRSYRAGTTLYVKAE